ncbi:MAG: choice-of-anchor Q domain-containing protein [Campylobacterota bacterium]|nr:choice-of-anchor Q domain-containing protein [Campylobacterota bacterium]
MKKLLLSTLLLTISAMSQTFNVSNTPELRTALNDAAANGQDDTIILADGTYKTTDDGGGTFIFLDNEDHNLTLKGSNPQNVILSGDNQDRIFFYKNTQYTEVPLKLEKLSFVDGVAPETLGGWGGGGVLAHHHPIEVVECNFTNNSVLGITARGGGFNTGGDVIVKDSSFINNSAISSGGGFSGRDLTVINSTFNGNTANVGGGFYTYYDATVSGSLFINNSSTQTYSDVGGGGFSAYRNFTVADSSFIGNTSSRDGGGFYGTHGTVTDSYFENNTAAEDGGGFNVYGVTLTNSVFISNSALQGNGGAFEGGSSGNAIVQNSIFTDNTSYNNGGAIYMINNTLFLMNSLFANNSNGIYLDGSMDSHIIVNNIFIDNNNSDIDGNENVIISYLYNNYINTSNVSVLNTKLNNIFDDVNLGFLNESNGEYNLTASSDLIDAGAILDISYPTYPASDIVGNVRVSGQTIDIGPYEYPSAKPTITAFTFSGTSQEYSELTFSVEYNLSDTRTVNTIEYDYTNDGSWTSSDTYMFTTAGTYVVNVKVTDDGGDYSTATMSITITELPFNQMMDEQKLIKAIDPTYYDDIMTIINTEIDSARNSGVDEGKQYVLDNLTEFNLVTQAELDAALADKKVVVIPMF